MKEPCKLILISTMDGFEHEIHHVQQMFDQGLECFHLRKPKFSTRRLEDYLRKIGSRYHPRIMIHSHHELCLSYDLRGIHLTSRHRNKRVLINWLRYHYVKLRRPDLKVSAGFHTLSEVKEYNGRYDYVFLSPVFDSISKVGYKSTFHDISLRETIAESGNQVIALGGVTEDKIIPAMEMGFAGVAVLGSVWKSKDPVERFKLIQTKCRELVTT
jgi:thiamine-phosphate pyrophosphorylase